MKGAAAGLEGVDIKTMLALAGMDCRWSFTSSCGSGVIKDQHGNQKREFCFLKYGFAWQSLTGLDSKGIRQMNEQSKKNQKKTQRWL